jgi:hypothetical protein
MIAFDELKAWAGTILCHPWDMSVDERPTALQDRIYLTESRLRSLSEWLGKIHIEPVSLRRKLPIPTHWIDCNPVLKLMYHISDDRGVIAAFVGWVQTERGDVRIYLLPERTARELRFILESYDGAVVNDLMTEVLEQRNANN